MSTTDVEWNSTHLCIVGARGYIGSALVKHLQTMNYPGQVMCINGKNDAIDKEQLKTCKFILYFGGSSNRAGQSQEDSDFHHFASTLDETQTIIYASSAIIYDGQSLGKETNFIDTLKLGEYGKAMRLRETSVCKFICKSIGLRLGTTIGISPNQRGQCFTLMIKDAIFTGRINVTDARSIRPILTLTELFNVLGQLINNSFKITREQHVYYNVASFNTSIEVIATSIARKTGAKCIFHTTNSPSKGFGVDTSLIKEKEGVVFFSTNDQITDFLCENILNLYETWQNPISNDLKCLVCDETNLIELIDLGEQCLANAFHRNDGLQDDTKYSLKTYRCARCTHSQLGHVVDPKKLFVDYIYVSGTSSTVRNHCNSFADKICANQPEKIVLDIACNDGTQLNYFKQRGWKTYGVDPAQNLAPIAREKGHVIVVGFWGDESTTESLKQTNAVFDVIVAQNVFAHVPNPRKFLCECLKVISESGDVYLQTSQAEIFQTGEFDTIYHEHLSFFSVKSMQVLAKLCGFILIDVEKVSVHGVSYIFHLKPATGALKTNDSVEQMIQDEKEIYSFETPIRYKTMAIEKTRQMINCLKNFAQFKIVGYGACAKGNTFLSFMQKLDCNCPMPQYIVDENPLKQGLFTPGTNILVKNFDYFAAEQSTLVVFVLAWNFRDEILQKIKVARKDLTTIVVFAFPEQSIELLFRGNYQRMSNLTKTISKRNAKTLLITHVRNEEYLLPFFIRHYATMFDEFVMIDYASTDRTKELFYQLAPSNWKMIQSRNQTFSAQSCDDEVRDIEQSYPNDVWKYAPTITEFLVFPEMDHYLSTTADDVLCMTSYDAVGPDVVPVDNSCQMLTQRAGVSHPGHPCLHRYMHRNQNNTRLYETSRHFVTVPSKFIANAYHIKLRCSPLPELMDRTLSYYHCTQSYIEQEKRECMSRYFGNLYSPSLASLNQDIIDQSKRIHAHFGTSWQCTQ